MGYGIPVLEDSDITPINQAPTVPKVRAKPGQMVRVLGRGQGVCAVKSGIWVSALPQSGFWAEAPGLTVRVLGRGLRVEASHLGLLLGCTGSGGVRTEGKGLGQRAQGWGLPGQGPAQRSQGQALRSQADGSEPGLHTWGPQDARVPVGKEFVPGCFRLWVQQHNGLSSSLHLFRHFPSPCLLLRRPGAAFW